LLQIKGETKYCIPKSEMSNSSHRTKLSRKTMNSLPFRAIHSLLFAVHYMLCSLMWQPCKCIRWDTVLHQNSTVAMRSVQKYGLKELDFGFEGLFPWKWCVVFNGNVLRNVTKLNLVEQKRISCHLIQINLHRDFWNNCFTLMDKSSIIFSCGLFSWISM
jgi:hypothetical protein